jgi:6-phosphogluconolactonase (cycloisomerase 2 family)
MRTLKPGCASQFAWFVALWAAAALIACGGGGGTTVQTPPPVTLQSITLAAPNTSVPAGFTEQFTATGNYSDGTTKPLATASWSTSDSTLATITSSGLLTTLKTGTVTVIAASGSIKGSVPFRIDAASLQSILVTVPNASVAAGLTQQLTATGNFSNGTTSPLATASWSTSDPTLATVSSTGLLTTLKPGAITVTAASGSITGSTPFHVDPPAPTGLAISPATSTVLIGGAQPTRLSAILSFTDNSTQDISTQVTWSSVNPFTASIDSVGNVTTVHTGYTKIAATNGSFSAATDFTVIAVPRFLYVPADAGRLVSRTTVDASSGQLRMAGYVQTSASNSEAAPCPTTDPSGQFLYVGSFLNSASPTGEIQIYGIDQVTGSLAPVVGSPFAIADPIACIQFEPTGKFGYATSVVNGTTELVTFSRDTSSGMLTRLNPISLNSTALAVAIDPIGKYLFAATIALASPATTTAQAYGYTIDAASGALTPIAGTPFQLPNVTGTFSWHPSGDFLFMANSNGQSIDSYSIDRKTGKLSFGSSKATCLNPTNIRFSPDGKFAYTACSMDTARNPNSASVESFAVGTNGDLTPLGSTPSPDVPSDLSIDSSGQFLYLSTNHPYVDSFRIGADGVAKVGFRQGIQSNPGPTLAIIGGSTGIQYAPKVAYVTSTGDNALSTCAVGADGTLGAPQSVATQLSPFSLGVVPWGSNLLLASTGASNATLEAFPLSPVTGAAGTPVSFGNATTAGGAAIDPSEQWAFETDSANNVVSTFKRIGTNWLLLSYLVNGGTVTTFSTGAGPGPVVIDASGRFLYVANQAANSISAYQYFGTSPELIESTGQFVLPFTDGSPFAIGAKPIALATDFSNAFLYVVCDDQTLRVYGIDYYSGGHIAQAAKISLSAQPVAVAAVPTGRFVYAADGGSVSAFSVDAQSGALKPITLNPAIQLVQVVGLYAEPSGKFLYVATNAAVFAYAINADGTLSSVSANAVATSNRPSSMSFSVSIQ